MSTTIPTESPLEVAQEAGRLLGDARYTLDALAEIERAIDGSDEYAVVLDQLREQRGLLLDEQFHRVA